MQHIEEITKNFDPSLEEGKIYEMWEQKKLFVPQDKGDNPSFCIVMPPPNITGQLHLGHAMDNTLADILIRFHRLLGDCTLFLPGTDHASIATEAKVVAQLKKEGASKQSLGREGFLQRTWQWKEEYKNRITEQQKRLGISCDWDRQRFTMDEGLSKAVTKVFVDLYNEGLIYRHKRMINWCPCCHTSISDIEVEYEEQEGALYYIKYPLDEADGYIVVATTRPETMLGDTAVAVNPEDSKTKAYIGKKVRLPLTDRIIPIIGDDYVDPEYGTGFVKITPAHDPNDYEIGLRHNLPEIEILDENAVTNAKAGTYAGLTVKEARKAVLAALDSQGLLLKTEKIKHNVGTCSRCGTTVEPKASLQWFVKMADLAKPAIAAVRNGDTEFIPQRFEKIYFNWMENIRDWCISRQLWWGHRIPAWYCKSCGEVIVASEKPHKCPKCGSENLYQDEDTLDTWFSSALWPFSTLGWPEATSDFKRFFPTNVLVTGYDIIFFWVARMIFSSLKQTGQVPFAKVLIHGLMRDAQGRKMSKSLNNGIDPLKVIAEYGADALRYAIIYGCGPGNDQRYQQEKIEAGRNFMNKLWNAYRFVVMKLENHTDYDKLEVKNSPYPEDRFIMHELRRTILEVTDNLQKMELGLAQEKIYQFLWDECCDWYIELVKERADEPDISGAYARVVLYRLLIDTIKLLHPFMPFITEKIYMSLQDGETLINSKWPCADNYETDAVSVSLLQSFIAAVRNVRNLRAEYKVNSSRKTPCFILAKPEFVSYFRKMAKTLERLCGLTELKELENPNDRPKNGAVVAFPGGEIIIAINDLVDVADNIKRLEKDITRLQQETRRAKNMLENQDFVAKAPAKVIAAQEEKLKQYQEELSNAETRLAFFQNMD